MSRVTKVAKKTLQKIFQSYFPFVDSLIEYGESLHPILLDSFGIFLIVISTQSDKWKIFRLFQSLFIKKDSAQLRISLIRNEVKYYLKLRSEPRGIFAHFCCWQTKVGLGFGGEAPPNNKSFSCILHVFFYNRLNIFLFLYTRYAKICKITKFHSWCF